VDDQFVGSLVGRGLFQYRGSRRLASGGTDPMVTTEVAGGYAERQDRIWSLPPDAPEWAAFRSLLVLRIEIAGAALERAQRLRADVRELSEAVDQARNS
jgi:hypothetical protein